MRSHERSNYRQYRERVPLSPMVEIVFVRLCKTRGRRRPRHYRSREGANIGKPALADKLDKNERKKT